MFSSHANLNVTDTFDITISVYTRLYIHKNIYTCTYIRTSLHMCTTANAYLHECVCNIMHAQALAYAHVVHDT